MNKTVEVKHYKVRALPTKPKPNSIYYVLEQINGKVKTYITDMNGFPIALIDEGVLTVTGTGVTGSSLHPKIDIATFVSEQIGNQVYLSILDGKLQVNPLVSPDLSLDILSTSTELQIQLSADIQNQINISLKPGDNISELFNDVGYITVAEVPPVTSIVGITGTKSEYNTSLTDGDFLFVGDVTDEQAQDAVGNILVNTSTIDLNYNDLVPSISASIVPNSITNTELANNINISEFINNVPYATESYVDSKIPVSYSKIVYVNTTSPTTATIFDLNNPPVVNDNSLKTDVNNLYIGTDASTWVYITSPAGYITKAITSGTSNFYLGGTSIDAGGDKTTAIERAGTVGGAPGTASNHFITKLQLDKSRTELSYACSDEVSDLTVGLLITFRMPIGLTLTNVKLSLNTAPTVSKVIVDIKKNGTTIFSTLSSVDTGSTTSVGASVPAVISDSNLVDDSIITISTTQVGSGIPGKGLKVTLIGNRI